MQTDNVRLVTGFLGSEVAVDSTNPLPVYQAASSGGGATKFASISVAASGDNSIVAAVTGKKIRVLAYTIVVDGDVAVKWRSAAVDVSGAMSLLGNSGVSANSLVGLLETAVAAALQLNLSAAVGVRGHVTYVEV